jgi:phage/plasmid-like protein (TIGR03299 family)
VIKISDFIYSYKKYLFFSRNSGILILNITVLTNIPKDFIMAHELAKSFATKEYRMAYRYRSDKDVPWHDNSTNCKKWVTDPNISTVLHDLEAYIDVVTRPVFDQEGNIIEEVRETWRPYQDAAGTPIKDKDGKTRGARLGIVGPNYHVLQDHEVVKWFEPWVDNNLATIETGGAIFNGTKFWVLAKLNKDPLEVVKDDPMEQYVLAFNGHDGKTSFRAFPTDIRVVCSNTASIALKSKLAKRYRAKHSRLLRMKVDEIRDDIEAMREIFVDNVDKFKHLAAHKVKDEAEAKLYFQKVLQEKEDPDKEIKPDGKRPLHVLMRLFDEEDTCNIPGVKGTWWAAHNAVSFFCTHLRGRNSDARLDNMISGLGQQMTSRALDLGLKGADGVLSN